MRDFIWIIVFVFALLIKILNSNRKKQVKGIDKSKYYRDIPCDGDINVAFWLLFNYSDFNRKDMINRAMSAYLLKWYKLGYIDIINQKDNDFTIDLKHGTWKKTIQEQRLYLFFRMVSGDNRLLEKNEITNYCKVNQTALVELFKAILNDTKRELLEAKKIFLYYPKSLKFIMDKERIILSEELVTEYGNLMGLYNFLNDYTGIQEKGHVEVKIWEEYLIFANLFGIANKVKDQFKTLYNDESINESSIIDLGLDGHVVGAGIFVNNLIRLYIVLFITTIPVLILAYILVYFNMPISLGALYFIGLFIIIYMIMYKKR